MADNKTKEVQQTRTIDYKNFDLIKFKKTDNGVDVWHHEGGTDAGTIHKQGEAESHPDLQEKMNQLKIYMAQRLGLLDGWDFCRENLKGDLDVTKIVLDEHKAVIERCNIKGLTFKGDGELYGVMITGSFKLPKGGSIGIAVPKITFAAETLGYEEDIQTICEEIKEEVYAYRFQGKRAQTDIETEIQKVEEPELFLTPAEQEEGMQLKKVN